MHHFRARLRRALILAFPAACAPSRHPAPSTTGSSASSTSGTSSSGAIGSDLCGSCYRQGMVCNVYDTACVTDCSQCSCTPVIGRVGPTDGGYPDGGLPIAICQAACPDPNPPPSAPGYPDLGWIVRGCFTLDAGCPSPSDGGGMDGGSCVQCMIVDCGGGTGRLTSGQRRTPGLARCSLATYLQRTAELEALAVQSFERLAEELARLGAPRALVRRAQQASIQERGHARAFGHLARRSGAAPVRVAPLTEEPRSDLAIAAENGLEGCLRETWGAAVAAVQARQARHPALRRVLTLVAAEEAEHALLGWDVEAWFETRLQSRDLSLLRRQRSEAIRSFDSAAFGDPSPELIEQAGLPTAQQSRELWTALRTTVWG